MLFMGFITAWSPPPFSLVSVHSWRFQRKVLRCSSLGLVNIWSYKFFHLKLVTVISNLETTPGMLDGFGRDRFNFFHGTWLSFGWCWKQCWWQRSVLVVAEQGVVRAKAFPVAHPIPSMSSLGVHKGLEGRTARTTEANWPKGQPSPCGIMPSRKVGGRLAEELLLSDKVGINRVVVTNCFSFHHLGFCFSFPLFPTLFIVIVNKNKL